MSAALMRRARFGSAPRHHRTFVSAPFLHRFSLRTIKRHACWRQKCPAGPYRTALHSSPGAGLVWARLTAILCRWPVQDRPRWLKRLAFSGFGRLGRSRFRDLRLGIVAVAEFVR